MVTQAVTSIKCPNCGSSFTAPVRQIIDAQSDPEGKSRLLSGQINLVACPHCGFQGSLNAPFLYHDADLELALVYVPMELGSTDAERQQAIGDLTNRLMQQLPTEARKGYLLQPQTFFSLQSLVEALLEADEETREMVEEQRRKMALIEKLRDIDPDDGLALAQFVGENDDDLDDTFFELLELLVGLSEAQGDTLESERLARLQEQLLDRTSTGQVRQAQQAAVDALMANPTREELLEQLIASDERSVREALVAVGRQMLDYAFFQALTARIEAAEQAEDSETKDRLTALRKEVQEIRDEVDAATRAVLDARSTLVRELLVAEDPRERLLRHVYEIDSAFFSMLSAHLQAAERDGRTEVVGRLQEIASLAMQVLNELAPPEIRLLNRLATVEDEEQVRQLLEEERELVDQEFLTLVEQTMRDMAESERSEDADRLQYVAEQVKEMIAA